MVALYGKLPCNLDRLIVEGYDLGDNGSVEAEDYVTRYSFDLVGNRVKVETDEGNADATAALADAPGSGFTPDRVTTAMHDDNDRLLRENIDQPGADDDRVVLYDYSAGNVEGNDGTAQTKRELDEADGRPLEQTITRYSLQGRLASADLMLSAGGWTLSLAERSSFVYDPWGNRVYEQTLAGNPDELWHVIDEVNPAGYAQTYETIDAGSGDVEASYVLGQRVHGQSPGAAGSWAAHGASETECP